MSLDIDLERSLEASLGGNVRQHERQGPRGIVRTFQNSATRAVAVLSRLVLACNPHKISFLFLIFYIKSGGGMAALGDGENGVQKWKLGGGMVRLMNRHGA